MTIEEKKMLRDYRHKLLSLNQFVDIYPVKIANNPDYLLNILRDAIVRKNPEDVDDGLSLLVIDTKFAESDKYVDILCELLSASWHYKHEDIALLLQRLKSPKSINCLYDASLIKLPYLDYDDSYALARKCIHALADINTELSREKLELLSNSEIPIVSEKAKKQLSYYEE